MIKTLCEILFDSMLLLSVIIIPALVIALVMTFCANSIRSGISAWLGINFYVMITFPGVVLHEIGHMIFCLLFGHKIIDFKLFSPEENGTLGYVNHAYNSGSFYQRIGNFFIGTGPVWIGLAVIYFLTLWLLPELPKYSNDANSFSSLLPCAFDASIQFLKAMLSLAFWLHWQSWLWLVLVLMIGSHIALSPSDFAGAADGFIFLMIFLFGVLAWTRVLFDFNKALLQKLAFLMSMFYGTFIFLSIVFVVFSIILYLSGFLSTKKQT